MQLFDNKKYICFKKTLQEEFLDSAVFLGRLFGNDLRHFGPKDDVKDQVSGRKKNHAAFIHQSNGALCHVHTERIAIDTQLEIWPELTE